MSLILSYWMQNLLTSWGLKVCKIVLLYLLKSKKGRQGRFVLILLFGVGFPVCNRFLIHYWMLPVGNLRKKFKAYSCLWLSCNYLHSLLLVIYLHNYSKIGRVFEKLNLSVLAIGFRKWGLPKWQILWITLIILKQ